MPAPLSSRVQTEQTVPRFDPFNGSLPVAKPLPTNTSTLVGDILFMRVLSSPVEVTVYEP